MKGDRRSKEKTREERKMETHHPQFNATNGCVCVRERVKKNGRGKERERKRRVNISAILYVGRGVYIQR